MCIDPNDSIDKENELADRKEEEEKEDSIEENEFPPDSEQIYAWNFSPDVPF